MKLVHALLDMLRQHKIDERLPLVCDLGGRRSTDQLRPPGASHRLSSDRRCFAWWRSVLDGDCVSAMAGPRRCFEPIEMRRKGGPPRASKNVVNGDRRSVACAERGVHRLKVTKAAAKNQGTRLANAAHDVSC